MGTTTPPIAPQTLSLMTEIISYPVLLQHEEAFTAKNGSNNNILYDVSSWLFYLAEIDSLLEQMNDTIAAVSKSKKNKGPISSTTIGGKSMPLQIAGIQKSIEMLQKGRNLISERALSLLPGSYKLWKNYLDFRSNTYIKSTSSTFMQLQNNVPNHDDDSDEVDKTQIDSSYPISSSSKASKFKSTISAYERSLVRMNKYPRVWLSYIHFVVTNYPPSYEGTTAGSTIGATSTLGEITTIRRLFNRALLALPATQHDLIWNEYLCWVLNSIPPQGLTVGRGKNVEGPLVRTCKKNGGFLYGSAQTANDGGEYDGDDDDDDKNTSETHLKQSIVPPETVIRVLRRYAHYYNPTARELLANTANSLGKYGEAATLYCEILNDVDFLSVEGTTRHELWMKLANVCTEHPEDISDAGVNFEGIVRAVLKPSDSSNGGSSGFGWDVFEERKGSTNGDDENNEDDEEKQKQKKIVEQQNQLQASLGEMEGTLWTKLAQFHIRMGEFELARSIYEEAMESVMRVRDFSLIFDGYIKFEEGVIEAMMEMMDEDEEDSAEGKDDQEKTKEDVEDLDILLGDASIKQNQGNDEEDENTSADIELALARAESLMSRRPLLLNYVLLRQNPHNVGEWLRRAELYLQSNQTLQAISSLEESVKAVHSRQAINGSPAELFKTMASIYEEKLSDVNKARSVYERVCCLKPEFNFRESDDLAQCYTAWVEMELRAERWDDALSIARRSVAHVPASSSTKVTKGLSKSMRLWNLLLDLEESLGTMQTTKDAYNRLLELKVATPPHVINFASYLIEKKYFEESFTAYERGLDMFSFPHPGAKALWKDYLSAFQKRYSGTKIHRMRELFDRCLESCPPADSSHFFIAYGKFEEDFGLTKRALGVYERMCTVVPAEEKFTSYQLYIAKTIKYLGITATRPIYESAISALEDNSAAQICRDYAKMEASLQEIDRARTAFTYGAQLADPRRNPEYWGEWHAFEVSHGNEETFREMLRVKRGVQAAFSTVNYNAAEMGAGAPQQENLTNEEAMRMIAAREGVDDPTSKESTVGFVQAKRSAEIKDLDEVERRAAKLRKVTSTFVAATASKEENKSADDYDEEIDIDDEDDAGGETSEDDGVDANVQHIKTKAVPSAVFGGLKAQETTQ
mmetsp:Transcript_24926/g.37266  ORF Transcript_24926/g.37266 Transcript_24926/m.37266 type:complete len:1145 (+) Transcript_24926:191-3625(+)|eukprot:CAMPEP_0203675744 /NCGR_PEP_ID=MMETSP0090-20130426/21943_1 /ASSEMBLY_ACC=CAM_ASM_001088 /TAXON_ID=426623 /ORGANISM="Chaetoceros affinis, Strain CCMP159" /LENGTH=1144 /DNA_ID=CAMNT_0050542055 /DNA_START=179 /DNA_END=3616 /DNA_ORIENTATION=-